VRIPVTVKMRLGWDDASWSAPYFARAFEQAGVAAVTIHGRTRAQGFSGEVQRAGIRAVVKAVERIPVVGNGDVRSVPDAQRMFNETGCSAVAIGRGALLNPYFFRQLAEWETTGQPGPSPSYEQRLDFLDRHFHLQVEEKGERIGCLTFRKVSNWYSKVLRPGRELHQRLMLVNSVAEFEEIVSRLRERGAPPFYDRSESMQGLVSVPAGPNERW
jgi:tRNA-dihydrouridine synthase